MDSIAFWLVFGCCLAALFMFWGALSAIAACIFFHDQEKEEEEFFNDREIERFKNEDLLTQYYTARGWSDGRIADLLNCLDCSYPMSYTELVEYSERAERDATIRGEVNV